jgi:hypothetical protein
LRLVQGGRLRDALAALGSGQGIDEERRGADQALVHRGGGLERQQLIHEGVLQTTAKLRQGFGQATVLLRTSEVHFVEATRLHDGHVGAQPLADGCIRSAHCVFEQCQGQQDAWWDRGAPPRGAFGEAPGAALLNGLDQLGPGKGISPWADRMGFGNNISNLQAGAATAKPMLSMT